MKNFTLKILAIVFFTLLVNSVSAQTVWYKCYSDTAPSTLTADIATPDGATPDGTVGSWYSWTVAPAGPVVTTAINDPDGPGANDANVATVTWGAGNLGLFTFTATEFNQCDNTAGDQTTVQINRVKPDVTDLQVDNAFACGGLPVEITITGYPGAQVTYTLSGGAIGAPPSPVTIGTGGTATVTVATGGLSGIITFTVTSASFTATQPNGSAFNCSNTTDLTEEVITFEVGDVPTITPIQVLP